MQQNAAATLQCRRLLSVNLVQYVLLYSSIRPGYLNLKSCNLSSRNQHHLFVLKIVSKWSSQATRDAIVAAHTLTEM